MRHRPSDDDIRSTYRATVDDLFLGGRDYVKQRIVPQRTASQAGLAAAEATQAGND